MKNNTIIRIKGINGAEGLGIVMDTTKHHGIEELRGQDVLLVVTADVDDSFGVIELPIEDAIELTDKEIKEALKEVAENQEKFPYFIIQLNDIQELNEYHIKASDYVEELSIALD